MLGFTTSSTAFTKSSIVSQGTSPQTIGDSDYANIDKRVPRGWFTCDALEVKTDSTVPGSRAGTIYIGRSRPPGTQRATAHVAIKVVNIADAERVGNTLPIPAAERVRRNLDYIRGVAEIYDTAERGGEQIVVSELMRGQTIGSLIKEGRYHGNDALVGDHFEQALETMRSFHLQYFTINDFHSGNLMLAEKNNGYSDVKLVDIDEVTDDPNYEGAQSLRVAADIMSPGK